MSKVFFWQPVLTEHAVHTFAAAARAMGREAHWLVATTELAARKQQGWTPIGDKVAVEILAGADGRRRIDEILNGSANDLHIFASPFERGIIHSALHRAVALRKPVFLVSEPYAPNAVGYFGASAIRDRVKAVLRPLVYARHARRLRKGIRGIFAISPAAVRQFEKLQMAPGAIFPFGYFVPRLDASSEEARHANVGPVALRCAFVGALIPRKGVATAIAAVTGMGENPYVTLDVYGPGDISAYGALPPNIAYCGVIDFGQTQAVLAGYDVLLVPSLHDGWGVVVNEGILAGCAVVASHETGASTLIDYSGCGATFAAGDTAALQAVIVRLASEPDALAVAKAAARGLGDKLMPEVAGAYMASCIASLAGAPNPGPAPWC